FVIFYSELAITVYGIRLGDAVVNVRAVWIKKHVQLEDLERFLRLSTAVHHAVGPLVEIVFEWLKLRILSFQLLINFDRVFVTTLAQLHAQRSHGIRCSNLGLVITRELIDEIFRIRTREIR